MTTRTILVIDDEASWLRLMHRLLPGCGYEVHTALNCADGIRLAAQLKPDCILLDFHLPDGNALSVAGALHADEITNGIPIIVISGDPAAEIAAYSGCRASAFIQKGTNCVQVIPAALESILLHKCAASQLQDQIKQFMDRGEVYGTEG